MAAKVIYVSLDGYILDEYQCQKKINIPIVGWTINAEVMDFIAEVTITHCFKNSSNSSLEAVFSFPLDEASSVCAFKAEFENGETIVGKVKEKQQATQEYQTAVQSGKKASLLTEERPDIFTISVGSLGPHEHVKTTITYITTLKAEEDSCILTIPTKIAPRYETFTSSAPYKASSPVINYGHSLHATFETRSPIVSLACPSHSSEAGVAISQPSSTKGTFNLINVTMGKDIVLKCTESSPHEPRAYLEASPDNATMVGLVTLFPKLEFRDVPSEIIFVIDRSGSMGGAQIQQARLALQIFLRALPCSCLFNIIGFGSHFQELFVGGARAYDDESLRAATGYAESMQADFGGTELLGPLRSIFARQPSGGLARQIFVLTDGQVNNEAEVFRVIEAEVRSRPRSRVFSLGIGDSVSHHLVEGMGRAGRGTARFVR